MSRQEKQDHVTLIKLCCAGLCCSMRLGEMGLCWQLFSTKARPATVMLQHLMPTHAVTSKYTHKFFTVGRRTDIYHTLPCSHIHCNAACILECTIAHAINVAYQLALTTITHSIRHHPPPNTHTHTPCYVAVNIYCFSAGHCRDHAQATAVCYFKMFNYITTVITIVHLKKLYSSDSALSR